MGSLILLVAFVVEAAFATYCIVTKSNQRRVRSGVRIGALAVFVLFTLVSVIEWSSRWYLLAALLVAWAALGGWALMRQKPDPKEFKAGRTVFVGVLMLLLVAVAVTPALIFPQYQLPKTTGRFQVATASYTYTDPSRVETFTTTGAKREVNVQFWYPKVTDGKYPLVVFSPGSFGTRNSNTSTYMELASNGYVVCAIDHPYHSLYTRDAEGHGVMIDQGFLQEFMDANNGKYDDATEFKIEQKWLSLRTTDINFALDTILARSQDSKADAVYGLIDGGKIGLFGHSLGGAASAQVARERSDIGAVINLDADLLGEYVDEKGSLNATPYPVPILTIFADDMVKLIAAVEDPSAVAVIHVTDTAAKAYQVHLTGTDHMGLTDLPLISPALVSLINASVPKGGGQETDPLATIEKMNATVLQFFDVYLKGEGVFTVSDSD